ncbi:Bacteriophytochrome cph2 [Delftia tsuruhatensis]|uniref:EAL domain-containing protein n=1 Tax=Delftia tsuruhatensis TaxID=180282 RepID=UPI001E7D2038|nr:EAL domain-containing protein [Delftia tsuruhatensis]CAB5685259.1 Bacteriophytochrome cph2 [Delftia tsuruhatensis]CAC9690116.1 Bacteriophytochrome cph2 [Delftia tsuruhatensis]
MRDTLDNTQCGRPVSLMIWLANLEELKSAYGGALAEAAVQTCLERLAGLGMASHQIARNGATIMVADFLPQALEATGDRGEQRWAEAIQSALGCDPVQHASTQAYLQVEVEALGCISMSGAHEMQGRHGFSSYRRQVPESGRLRARWSRSYQDDMQLAGRLLDELRLGQLALALQPVAALGADGTGDALYHECLLRRRQLAVYDNYTVPEAIEALERLGLVSRLDRSVLWSVLGALQACSGHSLGCNLSASSFVDEAWWDGLFTYLEDRPDVARRLVVEITETSAFPCERSALALVRHLQILGVRVALDDIAPKRGGLDILSRLRANIIKLDRSVLEPVDGRRSPRMLQDLVRLCADGGACVVLEGIESAEDLVAAWRARVHGVQGFFVARPSLLRHGLFDEVVGVEDVLQPTDAVASDWAELSLSWAGAVARPEATPYTLARA